MQHHFTGILTMHDAKHHFAHTFTVPDGATRLRIELWHAEGWDDGLSNMLTLSLFDPQECRGAGHRMGEPQGDGSVHRMVISTDGATPGYIAGPLQPGQWVVVVDAHRVTGATPCAYRVDVDVDIEATEPAPSIDALAKQANKQPASESLTPKEARWYRGDLHGHTLHSDGRWTVPELVAWARMHQLDFVTLSDHNTISGLKYMDAFSTDQLLTMGGLELTTFHGHALALGLRRWVDWRTDAVINMGNMSDENTALASSTLHSRTMPKIAEEVIASGGMFVVAHPMAIGDPTCTGCSWTYEDMMPGPARVVEVWNGGDWSENDSNNDQALALYYNWLNEGHRLVATSGTDVHGPFAQDARIGFNVVFAEALTERAIISAVRQGHLFISAGPHVELTAHQAAGATAIMGDVISMGTTTIRATWSGCASDEVLKLIRNGECIESASASDVGERSWQTEAARGQWFAMEVRDGDGNLVALTNPIFIH